MTNKYDVQSARVRAQTLSNVVDGAVVIAQTAIWAAALVGCAYFLFRTASALAGKDTNFKAVLDLAMKVHLSKAVPYVVATLTGGGWYAERKLRQRTIKGHEKYIRELEAKIDPKRSSSELQADGRPNVRALREGSGQ